MSGNICDEMMDILMMRRPWKEEHRLHSVMDAEYPDGKQFCGVLTHDVDEIKWSWRRKMLMTLRHPSTLSQKKNHYWGFEDIMDLEAGLNVRSAFYFITSCRSKFDGPYEIEDVGHIIKELDKGGWEIGLHGSYLSFNNYGYLKEEKRILESIVDHPVAGVRQHYTNFEPETTWRIQERCGFEYDSSVGYAEKEGFKVGYCYPYRPRGMKIYELPLTIMDCALFRKSSRNFDYDKALNVSKKVIDIVKEASGVAVLDWHNNSWDRYSFPGWSELYAELVGYMLDCDGYIARAQDLIEWWVEHDKVG
ncbi:MAG: polysaccharide deacetylase family protein [Thermoplasmata archaeon]